MFYKKIIIQVQKYKFEKYFKRMLKMNDDFFKLAERRYSVLRLKSDPLHGQFRHIDKLAGYDKF